MLHLLPVTAFVLYLLTAVLFLIAVLRKESDTFLKSASLIFDLALLVHTLSFFVLYFQTQAEIGLASGNYFYYLAWALAITYMFFKKKLLYPILGVMISAATALFMLSSSYLVHQDTLDPQSTVSKALLGVHVIPAIAAEVCLVLCFIVSLVFLLQERRLKTKSGISLVLKGPSLDNLTNLQLQFLVVGFVAMSIAILSGCVWAWSINKSLLTPDFLQWTAFAAWVLLGYLLHLRLALEWPVRLVSKISLYAGGGVVLALLLVRFVAISGVHAI